MEVPDRYEEVGALADGVALGGAVGWLVACVDGVCVCLVWLCRCSVLVPNNPTHQPDQSNAESSAGQTHVEQARTLGSPLSPGGSVSGARERRMRIGGCGYMRRLSARVARR